MRKRNQATAAVALALAAGLAGCGNQVDQTGPSKPEPKVELQTLSADEVFALVKKKQGKVVVMDCWSTYCGPCMKEFHGLVDLHKKYGDKVACISVSLDFSGIGEPEDSREAVLAFLKEKKATFDNVLSTTPDQEFYQAIQQHFHLAEAPPGVPVILVLDKEGKLASRWDTNVGGEGEFSYAKSVEPVVEKLLRP